MPPNSRTPNRPKGRVGKQTAGPPSKKTSRRNPRDDVLAQSLVAKKAIPKLKHKTYIEIVENEDKKDKKLDFVNTYESQPPPGYGFLPIGYPDLTNLCKDISREREAMIFVVLDKRYSNELSAQVNRSGYYVREAIIDEAKQQLGLTGVKLVVDELPKTQEEINAQADAALRDLFPRIPNTDRQEIIDHAFRLGATFKGDPMVGTQPGLPLSRRVQLAALAHIRHTHTRYDELLKEASWTAARKAVEQICLDYVVRWRGDEENGRDDLDEILREVVIISDDEDSETGGDDECDFDSQDSGSEYDPDENEDAQNYSIQRPIDVDKLPVSAFRRPPRPLTPPPAGTHDEPWVLSSPAGRIVAGSTLYHLVHQQPPMEIYHASRPRQPELFNSKRYARYQAAVSRVRHNQVPAEVISRVPPQPLAPAAPIGPRGIITESQNLREEFRDIRERSEPHFANVSEFNRLSVPAQTTAKSPVPIVQPQPQRPPPKLVEPTELSPSPIQAISPALQITAPVAHPAGDPVPIQDLVVPSVESNGPPRETATGLGRAVFVRPAHRVSGANNNGKRTRDSSQEGSPRRRGPDSPAVDSTGNSPYKRIRYEFPPTSSGPSGYSVRDAPRGPRPLSHTPPNGRRDPAMFRVPPPPMAHDSRGSPTGGYVGYNDRKYSIGAAAPSARFSTYNEPKPGLFWSMPASSASGSVYTSAPPSLSAAVTSPADTYRPRAPKPGQHDNGAWIEPHQNEAPPPFIANRIQAAYPQPMHDLARYGPPPVGGHVVGPGTRRMSEEDNISESVLVRGSGMPRKVPGAQATTFFVRQVPAGEDAHRYIYTRDRERVYGAPVPPPYATQGPVDSRQSPVRGQERRGLPPGGPRLGQSSASNPIVLDD